MSEPVCILEMSSFTLRQPVRARPGSGASCRQGVRRTCRACWARSTPIPIDRRTTAREITCRTRRLIGSSMLVLRATRGSIRRGYQNCSGPSGGGTMGI